MPAVSQPIGADIDVGTLFYDGSQIHFKTDLKAC